MNNTNTIKTDPVSVKFDELTFAMMEMQDSLKIACAESSLEGDFSQVHVLSETCKSLENFTEQVESLSTKWINGSSRNHKKFLSKKSYSKSKKIKKKSRALLRVVLDGKTIEYHTATDTFVKTLETMGIENVLNLGKNLSGIPLISKKPTNGYQSQRKIGGWYVTTHSSTEYMKKLLEQISTELGFTIKINIVT